MTPDEIDTDARDLDYEARYYDRWAALVAHKPDVQTELLFAANSLRRAAKALREKASSVDND